MVCLRCVTGNTLHKTDESMIMIMLIIMILRWIFRKWDGEHGLDRCGLG